MTGPLVGLASDVMDRDALDAQLGDQIPGLLRYARSIAADDAVAEDLVSDTLVRALEKADSYRGESSLATWLHRILHNLAVDRFRRQREFASEDVAERVEQDWHDDAYTVDAATVVARAETTAELLDALVRLPFAYRTAVVLHDAKQRLRRGRMMLVSSLAEGAERREALKGVPLGCWEARSQVSDYLDDELAQTDRSLLEAHLDTCPTCPPLYASLVGATEALKAGHRDPDSVIDPAVLARIRQRSRAGGQS